MSKDPLTDLDPAGDEPIDRLDELTSRFLDEALTPEEADEFNKLLEADPAACKRLFEAAQLHADLCAYFREEKAPAIAPALPLPIPGLGLPTTH